MANLSAEKRQRMLAFLDALRKDTDDAEVLHSVNEIEAVLNEKKYGLVWEEHTERVDEMLVENIPVLDEVKERQITVDKDSPYNFLIEGDNLHSLYLLEKMYCGKVDIIYIDPPYNTGNNDFKYNDDFVDKNDTYRHSKWLSFMQKRLIIAKKLLASHGVIFISIDDHEQAPLKSLCDEVFGENNFISMAIHKNNSNKNQASFIGVSTEYVLIYAKDIEALKQATSWKLPKAGVKDIISLYKKMKAKGESLETILSEVKDLYKRPKYSHISRWNKIDDKGIFLDDNLSREGGAKDYTITNPNTGEPCLVPPRGWAKSYEELLELQKNDMIWYGQGNTPPRIKSYLTPNMESVVDSFWYYDNSTDTRFIKKIFGSLAFNNPKPLEMIKDILKMQGNKHLLVLDFFAGSGTTGHAVAALNKEDGGNRKYILCTNNENNICEDVTYQRLKNIQEELPHNLKYLKTGLLPRKEDMLVSDLLAHIKPLVELTYQCDLDNSNNYIFLDEEEFDDFLTPDVPEGIRIFIPEDIFTSGKQEAIIEKKGIHIVRIPECYYKAEMLEEGVL